MARRRVRVGKPLAAAVVPRARAAEQRGGGRIGPGERGETRCELGAASCYGLHPARDAGRVSVPWGGEVLLG